MYLTTKSRCCETTGSEEMDCGRLWSTISHADLNEQVFCRDLGIFHEDIEVAVFVEDPRLQQFVLHIVEAAALVRPDQIDVGVLPLWILVQIFHVRVCGRTVEVKVVFLNVLTVVALAVGEAKHTFFKNGVLAVPQGDAETKQLLIVADPCKPILAPVIGTRSRLVMREVVPGIAVLAIILADRTPLPLAQVRTPLFPGSFACASLLKSDVFDCHVFLEWKLRSLPAIAAGAGCPSPKCTAKTFCVASRTHSA